MNIRIERPVLNRPTEKENIALIDRWIADTADKLNAYISATNKQITEMGENKDASNN